MKIIYNNIIPFKGFVAINLFGIIFARKEYKNQIYVSTINYEDIHTAQMKEMLYIFFYIWYFIEWVVKYFKYGSNEAYFRISFEREAYHNQYDYDYIAKRKHYSWFKLI